MRKLNKLGFTTTEILAVVIVIVVIALILVNAIIPQADKKKKQDFIKDAQAYMNDAEAFYQRSLLSSDGVCDMDYCCASIKDDLKLSEEENDKKYDGTVTIKTSKDANGKENVTYTISISNGKYSITNKTSENLSKDGIKNIDNTYITQSNKCNK